MERFIRGSFTHKPDLNFDCTLFVVFFISSVLSLYEILRSCFKFGIKPLKAESLKNQIYLTYVCIIRISTLVCSYVFILSTPLIFSRLLRENSLVLSLFTEGNARCSGQTTPQSTP